MATRPLVLIAVVMFGSAPALAEPVQPPPAAVTPQTTEPAEPALESRLVLRYKQMELRPDIKLYLDYQISPTTADNAFHITRGYLGLKVKVTSWLSGRITMDVSQASDLGRTGAATVDASGNAQVPESKLDGSILARLKYGYLEAALPGSVNVMAGVIHTPYIYWMEHIEGSRFLRKILLEEEYGYPSADLGIAAIGHVRDYLDYAVGFYNGGGYAALEKGKYKDVIGRVSLRPVPHHRWLGGLQITGYVQAEIPVPSSGNTTHRRYGGAISYRLADAILSPDCRLVRGDRLALWLQAFTSEEGAVDALQRTIGVSGGGRVELPWRLQLIGRVDWFDPARGVAGNAYWRSLGAVAIKLHEALRVALDYQGRYPQTGANDQFIGVHTELGL
jgi:hypothetical protein